MSASSGSAPSLPGTLGMRASGTGPPAAMRARRRTISS